MAVQVIYQKKQKKETQPQTTESTAPEETTAPEEIIVAEDTEEGVTANFKSQHITATMTDFQKEIEIVKWLVKNVDYDYENLLAGTVPAISHESAGALLNKVCVCDGYSKAFIKMAQACGIEAEMRTGWAGENHAWNQVKLDDDWYNLDVTWEDPIVNGQPNDIYGDKLYGKYINLTNDQIHLDHTCKDGNERNCTATKYNNNTSSYYVLSGNIVENLQSDDYRMLIMKNNAYTYSDFPGGDWLFDDRRNEWAANMLQLRQKLLIILKTV